MAIELRLSDFLGWGELIAKGQRELSGRMEMFCNLMGTCSQMYKLVRHLAN